MNKKSTANEILKDILNMPSRTYWRYKINGRKFIIIDENDAIALGWVKDGEE